MIILFKADDNSCVYNYLFIHLLFFLLAIIYILLIIELGEAIFLMPLMLLDTRPSFNFQLHRLTSYKKSGRCSGVHMTKSLSKGKDKEHFPEDDVHLSLESLAPRLLKKYPLLLKSHFCLFQRNLRLHTRKTPQLQVLEPYTYHLNRPAD